MSATADLLTILKSAALPNGAEALLIGGNTEALKAGLKSAKAQVVPASKAAVAAALAGPASHWDVVVADNVVEALGLEEEGDAIPNFLSGVLKGLKTGGVLVFRQDLKSTKLNVARYTDMLDVFRAPQPSDPTKQLGFAFHSAQELPSSIRNEKNWQDIAWTLRKAVLPKTSTDGVATFRQFLDQHQYADSGIGAYEWIFGTGFISPGGCEENAKFVAELGLRKGDRVLDVGCGIGGNAFYTAKAYDVEVVGADLSSNMLAVAMGRAGGVGDGRVSFVVADAMTFDFPPNSFDAVYSRDCIIHIHDKEALFKRFYSWLRPGGKVVMTDYCVGDQEHSPEFKVYLKDRQYALRTIATYVESFKAAGFEEVEGRDMTPRFAEIIQEEMDKAETHKAEFAKKFPGNKYESLVAGWKNKVRYIAAGDHKWAEFKATKPQRI